MNGSLGYPMHGSLERTMNGGSDALWIGWGSVSQIWGTKSSCGRVVEGCKNGGVRYVLYE